MLSCLICQYCAPSLSPSLGLHGFVTTVAVQHKSCAFPSSLLAFSLSFFSSQHICAAVLLLEGFGPSRLVCTVVGVVAAA